MRLVTWNCCRGTFLENASLLDALAPDIAVLQECARPTTETNQCLWFGIRKVSNGIITTVAGSGASGFSGDNGPATSARLNAPSGIAVDSAGSFYIAETGNQRVRKVPNGAIATIAGNGTQGFSGDGGQAASAELNNPAGIAVDSAGNVYIADSANNRIRLLTPGTSVPAITQGGVVSLYSSVPVIQPGSWVSIYGANLGNNLLGKMNTTRYACSDVTGRLSVV